MNTVLKCLLTVAFLTLLWSCNQEPKKSETTEEPRKKIEMVTDYGSMTLELYDETPLHRDNFINLAKHRAYDSVLFHRVIKDFMIQAGDPDSKSAKAKDTLGEGDVPYKVAAEFNPDLFHKKGVLAAARDDNPEKASSGMQFYIVQGKTFNDSTLTRAEEYVNRDNARTFFEGDPTKKSLLDSIQLAMDTRNLDRYHQYTDSILSLALKDENFKPYSIPENQRKVYKTIGGAPHLDQGYTVFGEVVAGMEVLDSIANAQTGPLDRPLKDVHIKSVRVVN